MRLMRYEVLYIERAENTVYVCRKPPEAKLYRIVEAADKERIAKYIKYFAAYKPKGFYEDFCLNEKYYVVFFSPNGIPLKSESDTLSARKALKALVMLNPPLEIAVRILSREHIFVCGNELEFAYDLPEIDMKITRESFFARLADFLGSLYENKPDRDTEKWLDDLRRGKFKNLPTAYRFMPDMSTENDISDSERLKKIKSILPKITAVIAAAAAIITAIAIALDQSGEQIEYDRIDSLGTVDITQE